MSSLQENVSLLPYNTFGIDAKCRWLLEVNSEQSLIEFLADNESSAYSRMVLGGGSNVLFTGDFDGLVLKNQIMGIELVEEDDNSLVLRIGAGENWHELVEYTLQRNWAGLENLSLIPGNVGAAPIQNIGAYGVELESVFVKLEAIHLESGQTRIFNHAQCDFGYRSSFFKKAGKNKYMISRVWLRLSKEAQPNLSYPSLKSAVDQAGIINPSIQDISHLVCEVRRSKLPDPEVLGNAGSFFKNPVIDQEHFLRLQADAPQIPHYPQSQKMVKIPAAWLIQQCGWKGYKQNGYGVHERQALVLVNYEHSKGEDILRLSQRIQESVFKKFAISLEREVNVIPYI